jgi:hypothetical protein
MLGRPAREYTAEDLSHEGMDSKQLRGQKRKAAPVGTIAANALLSSRPSKRRSLPWSRHRPWSREDGLRQVERDICALLLPDDLKEVRLVSRAWAKAAEPSLPTLFQTVFLHLNLESFEKLQQISRNDKLRKLVKTVVYNGRTLAAREGFGDWLRWSAGAGLGMLPEARDKFISQISGDELERCYVNFHRRLHGQEYILRHNHEKEMLVDSLKCTELSIVGEQSR